MGESYLATHQMAQLGTCTPASWKPLVPSTFGQPEPCGLPSPGSPSFQHKTQHPLIPMLTHSGNPHLPPVVQTPILSAMPQCTPVWDSAPRGMAPPHPSLGHPTGVPVSNSSVRIHRSTSPTHHSMVVLFPIGKPPKRLRST